MIFSSRINQNPLPDNHDDMDLDEPFIPSFSRPMGNPFDILDPSFVEGAASGFFGRGPQITHPREVRQIPIEVKDSNPQTGSSGQGPVIEDVTGRESSYGPEVHGTVIIDDDDELMITCCLPMLLITQDILQAHTILHQVLLHWSMLVTITMK